MEPVIAVIFWLGHACFVIQAGGATILVDPYNQQVGYEVPKVESVDVVTISHEHFDHNYVEMAAGKPLVLRGLAGNGARFHAIDQRAAHVRIRNVPSFHDPEQGKARGRNSIFVFEVLSAGSPVSIVHMGDFGEKRLSAEQIRTIGPVDVLLLPVGGHFTIGPAEADQVIADLKPKVVVPMHWKTAKVTLPIQDADPFVKGKKTAPGQYVSGNRLNVTESLLKRVEMAGAPLVAPLAFGPPPKKQ